MGLIRRLLNRLLTGPVLALPTEPIPSFWAEVIAQRVPLSSQLDDRDRVRLLRLTQLFIREVPMEGCGGLELTDEIRVTIAATASLLLLGLPYPRFPGLRRVLVYPDTFVPLRIVPYRSQALQEAPMPELGEAWRDGIVVLSWNEIRDGGAKERDGRNVVLHEFAHVLDAQDGLVGGTPPLESKEQKAAWTRVFNAEYKALVRAVRRGQPTLLTPYGASDLVEFFAEATACFFEQPGEMKRRHGELYAQLSAFYHQDPASWAAAPPGA